jgi:two-component system, LytTR family, sensor kinase
MKNWEIRFTRVGVQFLVWLILTFFLLYLYYDLNAPFLQQLLVTLVVTAMTALPAFYSAKVLVPRLLYSKKIRRFIVLILFVGIANTLFTYLVGGEFYSLMSGKSVFSSTRYILFVCSCLIIFNYIVIGISCAVQIITDRFGIEHLLHETEDEKIKTELSYLRAQINPHFLFNVLNTIYFQIHKENIEARNSVEKLSEMLRYQLYECNIDMIDISKELTYIQNYVAMQQLRMESGIDLQLKIPENIDSFKIAPLLILPIIENAFKYLSNYKELSRNKLYVSIYTEESSHLVVNVMNTVNSPDISIRPSNSNGLGLKNMERRLTLLYPGAHLLTSKQSGNIYETTLRIKYHD